MSANVHDNQVTEVRVAMLKAMTPHIIAMSGEERQRLIGNANLPALCGAWLKNGCRFDIKGPSALRLDRSQPFDPRKFIGRGWEIVEEDERSLALTEIDFSAVRFVSGHAEGEDLITGEAKLERLKALPDVRLDAAIGVALLREPGQATLRFIHEHFTISWFELAGTVLRGPGGRRPFLYLCRVGDGSWDWAYYWLDCGRRRVGVSPLLASSPSTSAT